jgi:hypothetical protein
VIPERLGEDARSVMRQALAGMLWSKQWYHYDVRRWLEGDPGQPPPPPERQRGRNAEWGHLYNDDVISMPDKWEYPWYAAWDLAFHTIALALVDPDYAKDQLVLFLREWYMHPNGQIPAYEWAFGDVNRRCTPGRRGASTRSSDGSAGVADRRFLERVFQKLLLNFTWWVNRKDPDGKNVFQGGFLGLDNIGVFDRSAPLPAGVRLEQSDATAWIGMYCLNMLAIALELAEDNPAYEDLAVEIPRALRVHRARDERHGRRGRRALERGGRLLLRRAQPAQRDGHAAEGPVARRTGAALRGAGARAGEHRRAAAVPAPDAVVPPEPRRSSRPLRAGPPSRRHRRAASSPW